MTADTKYFGPVDYEADDLIRFPSGLFGFEDEKQFLLLPFEGSGGDLLCLQSLSTPSLSFVVMNPSDPTFIKAMEIIGDDQQYNSLLGRKPDEGDAPQPE